MIHIENSSCGKSRLHSMIQLKNKKRLNAINAKKNRDIKKKQKQSMEKTMNALRQSNEKLQKKYSKSRQRLTAIEAQLQAIVSVIGRDQIDSMLKSSDIEERSELTWTET